MMRVGRIAACALAGLFVLPAPFARAAEGAKPPRAAMERVKKFSDDMKATVAEFSEGLARGYVGVLIRVDAELDSNKITKPEHRFYLQEKTLYTFIDTTLAQYDAFAADLTRRRVSMPAAFRVGIRWMLAYERDRLELFLREDPAIIRSVIQPLHKAGKLSSTKTAVIMKKAREAGESADAGPGFTNRLRRAARVGDAELRRVVTLKIRSTASDFTDLMADQYVKFLIGANAALDKRKITSPAVRAFALAKENANVTDTMLAEYDRFAAATAESFKGSGAVIEQAVADALAAERDRIASFLKTDPADLRAAYTLEDGTFLDGIDLRREVEITAEIEAEKRARFK